MRVTNGWGHGMDGIAYAKLLRDWALEGSRKQSAVRQRTRRKKTALVERQARISTRSAYFEQVTAGTDGALGVFYHWKNPPVAGFILFTFSGPGNMV